MPAGVLPLAPTPPAPLLRRCRAIAKWAVPTTILALVPKCPMCLAAWIGIYTGVGMTVTTASYLRSSVIAACVFLLAISAASSIVLQRKRPWKHIFVKRHRIGDARLPST